MIARAGVKLHARVAVTSAANVQVEEMLDFDVTFAELKGITDFLG